MFKILQPLSKLKVIPTSRRSTRQTADTTTSRHSSSERQSYFLSNEPIRTSPPPPVRRRERRQKSAKLKTVTTSPSDLRFQIGFQRSLRRENTFPTRCDNQRFASTPTSGDASTFDPPERPPRSRQDSYDQADNGNRSGSSRSTSPANFVSVLQTEAEQQHQRRRTTS